MTTPYHSKYFAYELTRQGGRGVDRLSRSLFDACVDLNPHQIEAALFAISSPVSKGVLLADEVGLGKTIEAGLVLCELWAEVKRKLMVVCPASLRKQWAIELDEKFNLPSVIIDAKAYKKTKEEGNPNPFDTNAIVIASTHYASRHASEIRTVGWDMVVIDEAHKLRNAYRESNRMGQNIRWALEDSRKILLTATPLQNSLLELYGLSTVIDDRIFGDLPSFRTQYMNVGGNLEDLRYRLHMFCTRTLRRQVTEYIKYTERKLITQKFQPTEQEEKLYDAVSNFLQKENSYALPTRQRHLTVLIVRKLLASSPQAVAGTLEAMKKRLENLQKSLPSKQEELEDLLSQIIDEDDFEEEILEDIEDEDIEQEEEISADTGLEIDKEKLNAEIEELSRYVTWARSIHVDTKVRALLKALTIGFEKMAENEAAQKAVIFTESKRTQTYVRDFLEANGYVGKVVIFNGSNREPEQTQVYEKWMEKNADTGRVSGSRAVDVRTALIEHFRDDAQIMIATEAGAEGINLQFCSLVVNYDLPWNPQRIEQRIGRCHRYGQKHDVVVMNFLNEKNHADNRVYELLNDKFSLFSGVFGASDDVLGSIESGIDFERRVLDIYQQCRSSEEIETAFKALQEELDEQIQTRMQDSRKILLEHFDEEVHSRLRVNLEGTRERLDRIGRMFWSVTKNILDDDAEFNEDDLAFDLLRSPLETVRKGTYHLITKDRHALNSDFLYRLSHPLGNYVIEEGKEVSTPFAQVMFNISDHPTKIAMIDELKGQKGWLTLERLIIDSLEKEEYLLFSGFVDPGTELSQEVFEKLFQCKAEVKRDMVGISGDVQGFLDMSAEQHIKGVMVSSLEKNNEHFNQGRERLEKWADDMVIASEKELEDAKAQIKNLNRLTRKATTVDEQHDLQEKIQGMERRKRRLRQKIFDVEDEIADKRDELIDALEKRMQQKTDKETLFTIRWKVI